MTFCTQTDFLFGLSSVIIIIEFHEWNNKINIILFYLPFAIHPANSIGFPAVDLKMAGLMINLNHYLIQTNPKNEEKKKSLDGLR